MQALPTGWTFALLSYLVYQKKVISKLHLIQNSAAKVLTRTTRGEDIAPITSMHRLTVSFNNDLKIIIIIIIFVVVVVVIYYDVRLNVSCFFLC